MSKVPNADQSTERPARPGEVCSCGKPAIKVYVTERFGDVGYCGRPHPAADEVAVEQPPAAPRRPEPSDRAWKAIDVLNALECASRDSARRMLGMYAGRQMMTGEELRQVLDYFTEYDEVEAVLNADAEAALSARVVRDDYRPGPLVKIACDVLGDFNLETREQAESVLNAWIHVGSLTAEDRAFVLECVYIGPPLRTTPES